MSPNREPRIQSDPDSDPTFDPDGELKLLIEDEEATGALVRVRLPEPNPSIQRHLESIDGQPSLPPQENVPLRWSNW